MKKLNELKMGVKAISLPDDLIKELEDAARLGGRGFSAEVRIRLENEKTLRAFVVKTWPELGPTGVATDRQFSESDLLEKKVSMERSLSVLKYKKLDTDGVVGVKVVPGDADPGKISGTVTAREGTGSSSAPVFHGTMTSKSGSVVIEGAVPESMEGSVSGEKIGDRDEKSSGAVEMTVRPGAEITDTRSGFRADEGQLGKKFPGVSKLAEKIASEVPGVKKASDLEIIKEDFVKKASADIEAGKITEEDVKMVKSAKKRPEAPEGREGRVELVKGFWREEYSSAKMAELAAEQMGWEKGAYDIRPIKIIGSKQP